MNQGTNQENPSTLVPTKRVRLESGKGKNGDQEQIVLTFGLDKEGGNNLKDLYNALTPYVEQNKQVNFDIRITEKTSERGTKFPSAFVLVREMIPRAEGGGYAGAKATFTKKPSRQDAIKAQANKFKNGVE